MSTKMKFWLIIGVALLLCVLAWSLVLPKRYQRIEALADDLNQQTERLGRTQEQAIGEPTLNARNQRQEAAQKTVDAVASEFKNSDAAHLDVWFPDFRRPWLAARPLPADFKRFYLLEKDALARESLLRLEALGAGTPPMALTQHDWETEEQTPDPNLLRALQREFWIEDHLVRALASAGAWPVKSLEIGRRAALGSSRLRFASVPVTLTARAHPRDIRALMHAFDGVLKGSLEKSEGGLRVSVRNVALSRVEPDAKGKTFVDCLFDLAVLDFLEEGETP